MFDSTDKPIVLFDGVCNLCESTVHFIIHRDRDAKIKFASLQSAVARRYMTDFDYQKGALSSVLLIADGKMFRKSQAALQILRRLDGAWPLVFYLFFWIPRFVADPIYDFVGDRRYRWYGAKNECWLPNDDLRPRFIDDSDQNL